MGLGWYLGKDLGIGMEIEIEILVCKCMLYNWEQTQQLVEKTL
tara:strand:- start:463 stop:591 length:129 start_codon:yes stop_codon:yes gene_type:complete